jgi:hypothetical protein
LNGAKKPADAVAKLLLLIHDEDKEGGEGGNQNDLWLGRMTRIISEYRCGCKRQIIIWVLLTLAIKSALVGVYGMAGIECVFDWCGVSVERAVT